MQGFRELVQLHLANEADRKAARKQEELRKEIASLEEGVARARQRLELADGDVKRNVLDRKAAELEVQKLEDQRSKYRSQLMTAKTNEVYRTLISEIETTAKHISEKETVVLQLMEGAEALNAVVAESKRDLAKAETARATEEKKLQADVASLQDERDQAQARAAELAPAVPQQLFAQYKRIAEAREGRGMALAERRMIIETHETPRSRGSGRKDEPVLAYMCTECHMTVRPQEWVEILDPDKVMTCAGCRRILYRAETVA
jgi:predicted  nucleic acid-binding Zn-ribbon protein